MADHNFFEKVKSVPHLFSLARKDPGEMLRWIIEQLPDNVHARVQLAQRHLEAGKLEEATVLAEEAATQAPDDPGVLGLRGRIAQAQGKPNEAVRLLARAYRANPHDDATFAALVAALVGAGRCDEALQELERKLEENPRQGAALAEKGRLLVEAGRLEQGLQSLEAAESLLEPGANLLAARLMLGKALQANRYEEASAAFLRARSTTNWPTLALI